MKSDMLQGLAFALCCAVGGSVLGYLALAIYSGDIEWGFR